MALDIFLGLDAELLDVERLAELHRKEPLFLVARAPKLELPVPVFLVVDGEAQPIHRTAPELLRLAAVGRYALRQAALTPHRPVSYVIRSAREVDAALRARMALVDPPPVQPAGPPDAAVVDDGEEG